MAVSGSTQFDVDASPEEVMDAVAAVEDLPQRSPSHKSARSNPAMKTAARTRCAPR